MCGQEVAPEKKIPTQPPLIPPDRTTPDWRTDQMRRWCIVDSTGIWDFALNNFQIMEYAQISVPDMMIFDRTSMFPCTILGREGVILLDHEIIKMIIKPEEVLVMEIREPDINCLYDKLVGIFDENDADHDYVTPLEFRVLEVGLGAICSYFNGKADKLDNDIHLALREVTLESTQVNLERVQVLSRDISKLKTSVEKVRDELVRLMGNNEDIASLYLSRTVTSSSNVEEILRRLWPYFAHTLMVGKKLSELEESVDDKLEFIKYQLVYDETRFRKSSTELTIACNTLFKCVILYWFWVWYQSLA